MHACCFLPSTYCFTETRESRMWCEELPRHLALDDLVLHDLLQVALVLQLLLLNFKVLPHLSDGGDVGDILRNNLVHKLHPFPWIKFVNL